MGYDLDIGASGMKVRADSGTVVYYQEVYTEVSQGTRWMAYTESERKKQYGSFSPFGLGQTGVVDYPTWYKIQEIYGNHENRRAILKELFLFTDKIPRSVLPGTERTGTGKMLVIEALPF